MDVEKWIRTLPVLKSEKNPTTALIIGFLAGGIGLAIYFRKLIDLFIPIFANILALVFWSQLRTTTGSLSILVGAVIAGCYGYLRAKSSNEMLRQGQQAPASISSASPGGFCAHCGHQLDLTAAYCPACGTHISPPAAPVMSATPQVIPLAERAVPTPPAAPAPLPTVPATQTADWWNQTQPKPADSNPAKPWW